MKAAVIGSGAWGTALAIRLSKNGHDVTMWTYEKDLVEEMNTTHRNPRLPKAELPEELVVSPDYACAKGAKLVVMASPSFPLRSVSRGVAPYIDEDAVVVSVTKGLEAGTHLRMSQVVAQETGKEVVVLTGPSHAEEVSINIPTGLLAASQDQALAEFIQDAFMCDTLRVYTSADPVGAELAAALKNVIALCAGICDGLGYGDNTKAALMTRGLAEMARLGQAMGGRKETFSGLTGAGDLIVTCTSTHSRNRRCGVLIGQGVLPSQAVKDVGMVVEGYYAAAAAKTLAEKAGVEMPITQAVWRILYRGKDPKRAAMELMAREKKAETEETWT